MKLARGFWEINGKRVNEDAKTGEEGAKALRAAADALCSWGYMNEKHNQHYPFHFDGAADDPIVWAKMKELAGK